MMLPEVPACRFRWYEGTRRLRSANLILKSTPLIRHGYCEEEKRNTIHENKFKEDVGKEKSSGTKAFQRADVLAGV